MSKQQPTTSPSLPPLAGQTMSGADIILQVLAEEGVDTIFGYSGGAILPTYDAIFRYNMVQQDTPERQINLIVPANEQGAGFMAAGYARASGRVGVCVVTSGPGATNTVTPIADSMADSVPIVVITGQVATQAIGTDAFQEAPVVTTMSPITKHAFLVTDPEKLEATVRTAFEIARSGRPGPVLIDIPKDIQNWVGTYHGKGKLPYRGYRKRLHALKTRSVSQSRCKSFFDMLEQSERPLIYAGGGVISSDASEALRNFANRYQIPVVTTLMGIGAVDTKSDLSLHMLGMHGTAYANYAVEDCDFLIAVGARFDDRVAGNIKEFAPAARHFVHIDIDASEIGKVKVVDWAHVGDVKECLHQLIKYGEDFRKTYGSWLEHVRALRQQHAMNFDRNSDLIQPYHVIEQLNQLTEGKAIVATGVGQHQMWAAQYFDFCDPRLWLTSGGMGTMGFGLPAAIGAAFACPDKIVIDVDGDGSIRMNLGELETATTYNLPVKVLLLNNFCDGMVKQWQKLFFGDRFCGSDKSLHKKDFIKAALADGFQFAKRLDQVSEVESTLRDFVEFDGPAFLEVIIDPDAGVYPMVGPGMSYKQMVTGEWIANRDNSITKNKKDDKANQSDMF